MNNEEERTTHPSFGVVGIYRTSGSGGRRLFGSELPDHFNTIRIKVKRAERIATDTGECVRGKEQLIEIEMSAAQFAELITTPNTGDGVPCTLRYVGHKQQPEEPKTETKLNRQRRLVEDRAQRFMQKVGAEFTEVRGLVDKRGALTVKERERIAGLLYWIRQELTDNMPFLVETFKESCDKLVTTAKAEIDAALTATVQRAGFEALAERAQERRQAAEFLNGPTRTVPMLSASVERCAGDCSYGGEGPSCGKLGCQG